MEEIWKDIDGFEGLYQVSNLGRVKCVEHKCRGRHGLRTVKEHIMCSVKGSKSYEYVTLSKGDRGRTFTVHRLVAIAFIPNPDNLPCVNHKDENKQNNIVSNLEWCTSLYNNTYNDVHKKRKRYTHRYNYDLDRLIERVRDVFKSVEEFKQKYNDDSIDEMIEELKQKRNGK